MLLSSVDAMPKSNARASRLRAQISSLDKDHT
jgi:hypothetical protein